MGFELQQLSWIDSFDGNRTAASAIATEHCPPRYRGLLEVDVSYSVADVVNKFKHSSTMLRCNEAL